MQYPQHSKSNTTTWHLTPSQIEQFDQQGYIKLDQQIPFPLLSKLQHEADVTEQQAAHWLSNNARKEDFALSTSLFNIQLNRLLHFHRYVNQSTLGVLGSPYILAPAQSLCGLECVPSIDMMVYKHPSCESHIPWHQDLIYPHQQYRVATIGIYLEDANLGDGALKIIPGSQFAQHDMCHFMTHKPQKFIEIAAKAGDVIIHNPMVVHASDKCRHHKRRTLYYEMRPLKALLFDNAWTRKLIHQRLNLMYTATHQFELHFSAQPCCQLTLNHCTDWRCKPLEDMLDILYRDPLPFDSVNYCQQVND